jgi:adenylylsulfate kinase
MIKKEDRRRHSGHGSTIIWLTGLSGSGKSTVANNLEKKLLERGVRAYVLDGDNIRTGLNNDLGFSPPEREENIRRIGEVAKLFVDAGIIVITAFISPYKKDRDLVRKGVDQNEFIEVFVKCSLEECERRDTKGLYKKVKQGLVKSFTGIDDVYEEPDNPEIILETDKIEVAAGVKKVLTYLEDKGYV